MTSRKYTPSDWFWIVAGGDAQVYSSAAAAYLSGDDGAYTNWLAAGNRPSRILNEAELLDVLQAQYPAGASGLGLTQAPVSVTMRQARLALLGAGLLDAVNAAITSMPGQGGDAARIEWEFSSEVRRSQPLVMALGPALGMSATQLDALFVAAAKL